MPFVIGSQTFGTTEIQAFDTDFLSAPESPPPTVTPLDVAPPDWQPLGLPWVLPDRIGQTPANLGELLS